MDDQPQQPRGAWVREQGAPLGLLAAAVALCCFSTFWVSDANYDGVISMLDPIFLSTCCGAVALLIAALVVWLTTRD